MVNSRWLRAMLLPVTVSAGSTASTHAADRAGDGEGRDARLVAPKRHLQAGDRRRGQGIVDLRKLTVLGELQPQLFAFRQQTVEVGAVWQPGRAAEPARG